MEKWKKIEAPYNNYEISSLGKVRNLKTKRKYLSLSRITNSGYVRVALCNNGKAKEHSVHRFVGKYYKEGYSEDKVVNHINKIKIDNREDNLENVTYSENTLHHYATLDDTPF